MVLLQLAKAAGISGQHLYDIVAGRRTPSPKLAVKLEALTGIDRRAWLYPEEFGLKSKIEKAA